MAPATLPPRRVALVEIACTDGGKMSFEVRRVPVRTGNNIAMLRRGFLGRHEFTRSEVRKALEQIRSGADTIWLGIALKATRIADTYLLNNGSQICKCRPSDLKKALKELEKLLD